MVGVIYISGIIVSYFILKSILEKYIYKKDKNKLKKTIVGLRLLAFTMLLNVIAYYFFGYTDKNILNVFFIFYAGLFSYHFLSFFVIRYKGTEKDLPEKIEEGSDIFNKLEEKIKSGKYEIDNKEVYLGDNYYYYPKNSKPFFLLKNKQRVSNKITNIYDFILITIISSIVISLSLPILLSHVDTGQMNSEYLYPLVAFLGAYVLSPFFPDLYYTLVFSKNDDIEFGSFIGFKDGDYIFGEVIDMNFFFIKLYDHYNKKRITVPHKKFSSTLIDSFNTDTGRYVEISYVVEVDDIDKLLELIINEVNNYSTENTKNLLIDSMTVKFDSHNYGYVVKLRVPVVNLKSYGSIQEDIRHIIVVATKDVNLSLETHDKQQIQIVKNKES